MRTSLLTPIGIGVLVGGMGGLVAALLVGQPVIQLAIFGGVAGLAFAAACGNAGACGVGARLPVAGGPAAHRAGELRR